MIQGGYTKHERKLFSIWSNFFPRYIVQRDAIESKTRGRNLNDGSGAGLMRTRRYDLHITYDKYYQVSFELDLWSLCITYKFLYFRCQGFGLLDMTRMENHWQWTKCGRIFRRFIHSHILNFLKRQNYRNMRTKPLHSSRIHMLPVYPWLPSIHAGIRRWWSDWSSNSRRTAKNSTCWNICLYFWNLSRFVLIHLVFSK